MIKDGDTPITTEHMRLMIGQDDVDGNNNKFEDFQQRAGKMMWESDTILMEKWEREEREKRIKEKLKA